MILTRIGQKFEGGYFAGVIRVKDSAFLVLASPKSTEHKRLRWKLQRSSTPGIRRVNDGWANTNTMNDSAHPAAQYCRSLTVGRHTDLYLPSRDELELCYRVFKPTARVNDTYDAGTFPGNLRLANGANPGSIPTGAAYTETNPAQTIVTAFQTGGIEAFAPDWYWTSTESSSSTNFSLVQYFSDGDQTWFNKTGVSRVRVVRRVPILLNDEKQHDTN